MRNMMAVLAVLSVAALASSHARAQAQAPTQTADTVLLNGKIVTLDAASSVAEALAIRDGKVLSAGTNADMLKLADPRTRRIDLGGRTVVPGLMDSHIHALRAGLTFSVELSFIGVPSLAKGLDLIREASRTLPPGAWIKIGGGWTELQFPEKRGPTVAELVEAAPDRPVYVQRLYNTAWITPAGMKLMKLTPETEIPGGKAEKDAAGQLTGVFTGVNRTFNFFTAKIPGPDLCRRARRHAQIFPRAQSARHDRDQRFSRRRHAAGEFPSRARAVAEGRDDAARQLPCVIQQPAHP